mgnify:FL=1
MKHLFNNRLKRHIFILHGVSISIEYRSRLKVWDLIFYPNIGKFYGAAQYYDKVICRNDDFTALVSCIIKTSEVYCKTTERFSDILKRCIAELTLCEALAAMETPAQGSIICD